MTQTTPPPATTTTTPKPRSRTMLYAIIIVILIVVGVGVYYLFQGNPSNANNGTPVTIWDTNGSCSPTASPANCGFRPTQLNVKLGTNNTVTWTNTGNAPHTATSNQTQNGSLPAFNSDSAYPNGLSNGQKWTFAFNTAGTYHYYCRIHAWMIATVVVAS